MKKSKIPEWFSPYSKPLAPVKPKETFLTVETIKTLEIVDYTYLTKQEILENICIDEMDQVRFRILTSKYDDSAIQLSLLKARQGPNKNYAEELDEYKEEYKKYKEELKEWKKYKKIYDEELKKEREKREFKMYKKLSEKFNK